jgi:hypothetical protein
MLEGSSGWPSLLEASDAARLLFTYIGSMKHEEVLNDFVFHLVKSLNVSYDTIGEFYLSMIEINLSMRIHIF